MNEIDPLVLGRQLRKPVGELGKEIGQGMNISNASLYELALPMLNLADTKDLLEIGFGNGNFFHKYFEANSDIHVTGLDYSSMMCAEAEKNNKDFIAGSKLSIICGNSSAMPFPDEYFDTVIGINTVYFWDSIEEQLKEIKRVLKKGGSLLIGYRPKEVVQHLPFTKEVFTLYNSEDLNPILTSSGFKIKHEKVNNLKKPTPDDKEIIFPDICVLAEKL